MTQKELIKLGFEFKILAVGNIINIMHRKRFTLNDVICTTCKGGYWLRSLEQKSIDNVAKYIKKIEF